MSHTPGPWWLEDADASGHVMATESALAEDNNVVTRYLIIHRTPGNPHNAELRANARLIAAAPDLLEALEALIALDWGDEEYGWVDAFNTAETAVAKARGES